jgi:hypothetical protein
VSRSRLIPLALGVTLLLAVVAIAAGGRPLRSRGGSGGVLPFSFWDYTYTTIVIVVVPVLLAGTFAAALARRRQAKPRSFWQSLLRTLVIYTLFIGLEFLVIRHLRHVRLHELTSPQQTQTDLITPGHNHGGHNPSTANRSLRFRWDELVIVLGLLVVVGAIIAARLSRSRPKTPDEIAPEALAAALDESLDDLRADPDLRRAIVAAYARMETALAAAGIPRHPAEAPLEYLERALLSLDTSADSVRRLTDLFEWARFSDHEPEPSMRDDAVDALSAVRDELRASELIPA